MLCRNLEKKAMVYNTEIKNVNTLINGSKQKCRCLRFGAFKIIIKLFCVFFAKFYFFTTFPVPRRPPTVHDILANSTSVGRCTLWVCTLHASGCTSALQLLGGMHPPPSYPREVGAPGPSVMYPHPTFPLGYARCNCQH